MSKIKEGDVLEGIIEFSASGNASIKIGEKELFIHKKRTLNALHMDVVKVETFRAEKKLEAKVTDVISRNRTEFVGTAQITKSTTFVVADSSRIAADFYISEKDKMGAENGQKVLVEFIDWKIGSKSPKAKIVKILGETGENNAEMNAIMHEYGLPVDFPQEVINESVVIPEVITEKEIEKRRDMRHITTITIDPVDAKDFDDAISIDRSDPNIIEIGVHIADVAHYVKQETELDKEAYKRGTSVYLVDRCVPMLPERLSNGICSLKPNEDRLAFSVVFKMDRDGKIKDTWYGRTVIHSDRRYAYEDAQEIIEGKDGDYCEEIRILDDIAIKMRKVRIKEGSIEIGGVEVKFKLAEDNKKPIGVYFKEQKEANKLIEEYMLLANKAVAKFIKSKGLSNVNRVHGKPDDAKLLQVKKIADNFGYEIDISNPETTKEEINKLIKSIKDTPEENLINTLIIRAQKKAIYSTDNETGHYGLGFEGGEYCHFTSPIRRYSDICVHRILEKLCE